MFKRLNNIIERVRFQDFLRFVWPEARSRVARPSQRRGTLNLLSFEDRIVPAVYTWNGPVGPLVGAWNVASYWNSTDYPRTTNDTAVFDGAVKNTNVSIPVGIEIGRIVTKNGYDAEIQLSSTLRVKKVGAGAGLSEFNSPVKIAPQDTASGLVLDGVQLDVAYGELGSTTDKSQLSVINGARLNFDLKAGVKLGMDLVVGTAVGGAAAGKVYLKDSDPNYQIRHLTVTNDANITVNKESEFYLTGRDGDGWILTSGITSGYIQVSGDFSRQGTGEIGSHLPFVVTGTGTLFVLPDEGSTTLRIDSSGVTGTGSASLFVESGGQVRIGSTVQATNVARLILQDDLALNGGTLAASGNDAYVEANEVRFTNSARLNLLSAGYTNLRFQLFGVGAKVQVTSGTWLYDVLGGGNISDRVIVTGGTVDISTTNTILSIEEHGTAEQGDAYYLIQALFSTITGDFDDVPFGFWPTIYSTAGGTIYQLNRLG